MLGLRFDRDEANRSMDMIWWQTTPGTAVDSNIPGASVASGAGVDPGARVVPGAGVAIGPRVAPGAGAGVTPGTGAVVTARGHTIHVRNEK